MESRSKLSHGSSLRRKLPICCLECRRAWRRKHRAREAKANTSCKHAGPVNEAKPARLSANAKTCLTEVLHSRLDKGSKREFQLCDAPSGRCFHEKVCHECQRRRLTRKKTGNKSWSGDELLETNASGTCGRDCVEAAHPPGR